MMKVEVKDLLLVIVLVLILIWQQLFSGGVKLNESLACWTKYLEAFRVFMYRVPISPKSVIHFIVSG